MTTAYDLTEDEEALLADEEESFAADPEMLVLDPNSEEFVARLVDKILLFIDELAGHPLFPYQRDFARRVVESIIINDGEEITALFSRQSGKTETVANVVAALMILLPKLAAIDVFKPWLEKFKNGFWVGTFAPVESQAETLFQRIVSRLTSEIALEIMADPEIDDSVVGGGKHIRLKKSGSLCRMQTANPKAQIESKSYHLIIVDESQRADSRVVRKSIHPMGAFYNATIVKTGTPDFEKGDFYKAIQHNKRRQTKKSARQNHFEHDWRSCARYNSNYAQYVRREKARLGEDSDEFQLAYALKWLLERGMFTTQERMDELGDRTMQIVQAYTATPVLVGIDFARKQDSTVVTVVWVDWERPDEFGYYDHRILNWLEIHGDQWEEQYFRIVDFLSNYNVLAGGVDAQGIGDVAVDRLSRLMPRVEWVALPSDNSTQSRRWKHLLELMNRGMVSWPAHARTRRTRVYRRFEQQMKDLEKKYQGKYLLAEAPKEAEAHDDYPDSLALAVVLTKEMTMPEVESSDNSAMYARSR